MAERVNMDEALARADAFDRSLLVERVIDAVARWRRTPQENERPALWQVRDAYDRLHARYPVRGDS